MVRNPALQRSYTYSVASFEGPLKRRHRRAVQAACKTWGAVGPISFHEFPAKLNLRVDFKFTFWPEGSCTIEHAEGAVDLKPLHYTTSRLRSRLVNLIVVCGLACGFDLPIRAPLLTEVIHWVLGERLLQLPVDLRAFPWLNYATATDLQIKALQLLTTGCDADHED